MKAFTLVIGLIVAMTHEAKAHQCGPQPEQFTVGSTFFKGHELVRLSEHDLAMYTAGFVDAFSISMVTGATRQCANRIQLCSETRTVGQFAAIVRKYLQDNPANWHENANVILFNAIFAKCLR